MFYSAGGVDGSSGSREQDVTNVKELENRLFAAQEAFAGGKPVDLYSFYNMLYHNNSFDKHC